MSSPSAQPSSGPAAVAALQAVLATEHAAIYGYPVIGVNLTQSAEIEHARAAEAAHRVARDGLLEQLAALGTAGAPAAVQYEPPKPVTDAASAQQWALALEQDCASAYRNLLSATATVIAAAGGSVASLTAYRSQALAGLTAAANDSLYWRALLTPDAPTVPFPGT
ncbi:MAG: hypothetical protein JWO63_2273 [Frankiales bacterium]|nr:hypothetical protein [Frankiales bacterium]